MTQVTADPITTEVVRNFLISCAEDMNAALWRSAYSALIYEGKDSAVAILDRDGNMLGQSTGVPLFVGAIDACVHLVKDRYGDDIHEGDIFLMNDAYLQGTHLNDFTAVGPLFYEGELVGFGAARAHWADVGSADTGMVMGSSTIFQEGWRLGPTRVVEKHRELPDWFDLLTRNTRLKELTLGDFRAQIAAIRTGERRLGQLLNRIGVATFRASCDNIFEQAQLLDRQAIAALKDGTYSREGWIDNDGISDDPVKVAITVTIDGERLLIDLEGSSPPVAGSINCGRVQTISLLRLAYKTMISPERAITGGSFSTMEVKIPEDCIYNAREPAACQWYFTTFGLLADLMISCLSEAMPDKATAAHYGDSMVVVFAATQTAKRGWLSVEATAGGWGGSNGADGESALINLVNGGFRNLPAEIYETKFPVRVEEFAIRKDSAGAGRWRGGNGVVRTYRLLDDAAGSLWFDRSKTPAFGLNGGRDAVGPEVTIHFPDGHDESHLKMRARVLPKGTVVETKTGGGGGFGDPLARPFAEIQADLDAGWISPAAAARDYGVTVRDGVIDTAASTARRS